MLRVSYSVDILCPHESPCSQHPNNAARGAYPTAAHALWLGLGAGFLSGLYNCLTHGILSRKVLWNLFLTRRWQRAQKATKR